MDQPCFDGAAVTRAGFGIDPEQPYQYAGRTRHDANSMVDPFSRENDNAAKRKQCAR